jgi:ATP-dependent DNA helicase RecQ
LTHGEKQLPGVLEFLETGNEQKFLIGFNNYFHAGGQKAELLTFIQNHFDARYDEKNHSINYDKAVAGSLSFEAYFESLFKEIDQWIDTPKYLNLKKIWYSKRSKSDTDKAIYRLTCIGIVDDFEVDYRNKVYHLDIQSKAPGDYVMALYTYLRRYYSDKRVRRLLEEHLGSVELPSDGQAFASSLITLKTGKNLKSLFQELVMFIVSFAYQEIAAKRKAAIRDVFSAFDEYLNYESIQTGSGNFKLKSYLHLYFNSKYAREAYKAKLEDPNTKVDYSLRDDTQNGNVLSFEDVLEYIQLMAVDISGSETDNIKHLRGAATRLLRSDTSNPSLRLLKAFSLFILAWQFDGLFQEACDDCEEGLMDFINSVDEQESLAMVNAYIEAVSVYLPRKGAEKVEEYFGELRNTLILRRNLQWLKGFNQRFLKDFKPQS